MNESYINSAYFSVLEKIENLPFKGFNDNLLSIFLETPINSRAIKVSLQNFNPLHFDFIEFFDSNNNKIEIKSIHSSSDYKDNVSFSADGFLNKLKSNGKNFFHTKSESKPWIVFVFRKDFDVKKIKIHSSLGDYNSRLDSLIVSSSKDFGTWITIYDSWYLKKCDGVNDLELAFIDLFYKDSKRINKTIDSCKKNNFSNATLIYEFANKISLLNGLTLTSHGLSKSFGQMNKSDKVVFYKELKYILLLLKDYGLTAFPSSGSLLGLVRDGGLIDHDDDLDVCYISNFSDEVNILEERDGLVDFLIRKGCKVKQSGIAHYWCVTPEGISVDIFTAFYEGDFCSMNPIGRKKILKKNMFPFIKCNIKNDYNFNFDIPKNYDEIMELNYGPKWKVKDPLWSFDWSNAKKQFKFLYFK